MEMDNSLQRSLQELVDLQRQQLIQMNDMSVKQSEQTELQRRGVGQQGQGGYFQNPYAHYTSQHNTNFMPPGLNPFNNVQGSVNQFQAYAGQVGGGPNQFGFMDSMFPQSSQMSPQMRDMARNDFANRFANASAAGVGAVGSTAATFGGYGLGLGMIGGAAAGAVGGAAVGAYFDSGIEQMKAQQAYDRFLERESYRFINATDSQNQRGIGGFDRGQRQDASDFLRRVNTDFYMQDDEMMRLMQNYTESGLLRDVNDLDSFKDRIQTLTKSVREGAMILNETYDSISDLMAEMRRSGIDNKDFTGMMSMGHIAGMEMGMSGSEAVRGALGMGRQAVHGTGVSTQHYTGRVLDTQMFMGHMFDQFERADNLTTSQQHALNYIHNIGGVQEASGVLNTMQDSFLRDQSQLLMGAFDFNQETGSWQMNRSRFQNMMSGDMTLGQMTRMAESSAAAAGDFGIKNWQENALNYMGNEMGHTDINQAMLAMARGLNLDIGADPNDISGGLASLMPGMDPSMRAFAAEHLQHSATYGDSIVQRGRNLAYSQRMIAEMEAANPTIRERVSAGFENFREDLASPFITAGNWISGQMERASDRITGRNYYDMNFSSAMTPLLFSADGTQRSGEHMENLIHDLNDSLRGLQSQGFSVDDGLIEAFTLDRGRSYSYEREVYADGSQLSGIVGDHYGTIQSAAAGDNLSETILSALLKFSQRPEGKELFGAHDSVIEQIKKQNVYGDSTEEQLKAVSKVLSDLVHAYGGNEDLALQAFFAGKGAIDQELINQGHMVGQMRMDGTQGQLQGVSIENISNIYNQFRDQQGNYNVTGSPWQEGTSLYQPTHGFGSKDRLPSNWEHENLMYDMAQELGVSPNMLASVAALESSGRADALGDYVNGVPESFGMFQVQPKWHESTFTGHTIDIGGSPYTIGMEGQSFQQDLMIPEVATYVGGTLLAGGLETNQGNPFLTYLSYNAGGGAAEAVRRQLQNNMGDAWPEATWEQVEAAARQAGYNTAADNMRNFGPTYMENIIIPDAPQTVTEAVRRDSRTGELADGTGIRDLFTGNADVQASFRQSDRNQLFELNDARVRNIPQMFEFGRDDAKTRRMAYLQGDVPDYDEGKFVSLFASMMGMEDDASQKEIYDQMINYYSTNYRNIEHGRKGWTSLGATEKAERLQMMEMIETVGLGLPDLSDVAGDDMLDAFGESDMEFYNRIDKDNMVRKSAQRDETSWAMIREFSARGGVDYGDHLDGYNLLGMTGTEAEQAIEAQIQKSREQGNQSAKRAASLETKIHEANLAGLSMDQRVRVRKAVSGSDVTSVANVIAEVKSAHGPMGPGMSAMVSGEMATIGILEEYVEAMGMQEYSITDLEQQRGSIGDAVKSASELSGIGQMLGRTLSGVDEGFDMKSFERRIGLGFLGQRPDDLMEEEFGELIDKVTGSATAMIEETKKVIDADFEGFLDHLGAERGQDFLNALSSAGIDAHAELDPGESEEAARIFLDMLATVVGEASDEEGMRSATDKLEEGTDAVVDAMSYAGDEFVKASDSLTRRIEGLESSVFELDAVSWFRRVFSGGNPG